MKHRTKRKFSLLAGLGPDRSQWACGDRPIWNRLRKLKTEPVKDSYYYVTVQELPLAGKIKEFGGEDVGPSNRIAQRKIPAALPPFPQRELRKR